MSRTKKKPRAGSAAFDPHCRNHNRCSYCRSNRTKFDRVKRESANAQLAEHIRSVGNNWTKEERGELRVGATEFFYGKRNN